MAPQVPNTPSSVQQRWRTALGTTGGAAIALAVVVIVLGASQSTSAVKQGTDRPVTDARAAVVVAEEVSSPPDAQAEDSGAQADQPDSPDSAAEPTAPVTVAEQTPTPAPTEATITSTPTETPRSTTTATLATETPTPTLTPVADQLLQVDPGVVASVAPAATSGGDSFAIPDMNQAQNLFNSLDPSKVTLLPTPNVPADGTNRPLPFPTAAVGTPVLAP